MQELPAATVLAAANPHRAFSPFGQLQTCIQLCKGHERPQASVAAAEVGAAAASNTLISGGRNLA